MYYLYYGNSFKEGGAVGLIGFPVGGNIDEIQCVKIEKHTFISLMILLHLKIAKMAIFFKKHSFCKKNVNFCKKNIHFCNFEVP